LKGNRSFTYKMASRKLSDLTEEGKWKKVGKYCRIENIEDSPFKKTKVEN